MFANISFILKSGVHNSFVGTEEEVMKAHGAWNECIRFPNSDSLIDFDTFSDLRIGGERVPDGQVTVCASEIATLGYELLHDEDEGEEPTRIVSDQLASDVDGSV